VDTDHVKVSNLHKIGKYGKEIRENRENYQQNLGKSELSHSQFDTAPAPEVLPFFSLPWCIN